MALTTTGRTLGVLALSGLALGGCKGSKWDGLYRVVFEFSDGSASYDYNFPDEQTYDGLLTVQTTTTGQIVFGGGGDQLLVGTLTGTEFEAEAEYGYNSTLCNTYAYQEVYAFEGNFTPDLGMDGTLTATSREAMSGCEFQDDSSYEISWEYDITGVRLNSHSGRHPGEGSNWGYTPNVGGSATMSGDTEVTEANDGDE